MISRLSLPHSVRFRSTDRHCGTVNMTTKSSGHRRRSGPPSSAAVRSSCAPTMTTGTGKSAVSRSVVLIRCRQRQGGAARLRPGSHENGLCSVRGGSIVRTSSRPYHLHRGRSVRGGGRPACRNCGCVPAAAHTGTLWERTSGCSGSRSRCSFTINSCRPSRWDLPTP
jgi:hypothetical protein